MPRTFGTNEIFQKYVETQTLREAEEYKKMLKNLGQNVRITKLPKSRQTHLRGKITRYLVWRTY